MVNQVYIRYRTRTNTKNRKAIAQSLDEIFAELLNDAISFDQEMKLRFVEAFFYASQKDIRQAMMDFDALGDADRLLAGYFLHSLASKAHLTTYDRRGSTVRRK